MSLIDRIRLLGADKTTYMMLDDVNLGIEAEHASIAHALAGYVNGEWPNFDQLVARYGKSGKPLLSIDVQGNPAAGARVLDVEKGDATIAMAPAWAKQTAVAGAKAKDGRVIPIIYTSADNVAALISTMTEHGIERSSYLVWSAHYTQTAHICGPHSCGYPQADATQWTSSYDGVSLDASLCSAKFFEVPKKVKPIKEPELRSGAHGPAVRLLQTLLNAHGADPKLTVDGVLGVKTAGQVKAFQRRKKLTIDGVVGPKTWAALGDYS